MALDIDMTNEYMYTHMYIQTNGSDGYRLGTRLQQCKHTHTWYMYKGATDLASVLHRYVYIHIYTYTYTYTYTYIYVYSLTSAGAICTDCSLTSANADTQMHIHTHNAYTHT